MDAAALAMGYITHLAFKTFTATGAIFLFVFAHGLPV